MWKKVEKKRIYLSKQGGKKEPARQSKRKAPAYKGEQTPVNDND